MFIQWFEGFCPECRLEDKEVKMLLNEQDFFECPDCQLQMCAISGLHAILLHVRGNGEVKRGSPNIVDTIGNPTGRILCEEGHNEEGKYFFPFVPGEMIFTEEGLRSYLEKVK